MSRFTIRDLLWLTVVAGMGAGSWLEHRRLTAPFGRWHASSRTVAALVLLFLVFCNIPGQHVKQIQYEVGHPLYVQSQFEHGWPLTFLIRAVPYPEMPSPSMVGFPPNMTIGGCFSLRDDVEELRFGTLLANGGAVLLATLACGFLFEAWRRARRRIWHLHLRDLFAVTLAVSILAAWWVHLRNRYAVQERAFDAYDGFTGIWPEYQEGGVTWLRMLLGDQLFQFLDRPISLDVNGDWSKLPQHSTAREVRTEFRATTEELRHLAKMPRLEALELGDDWQSPDDDVVAELPPLPRLRGLYLCQPVNRCRRIDRLTSLESLEITRELDEQAIREIGALQNLRQFSLDSVPESADLSFLPSLSKLSAVDFYNGSLSAASLRSIGQCRHLKVVSLYMAEVDGSGIRHLSNLANLEELDLSYTEVTSKDVAPLAVLKRLRHLNLNETAVDDLSFASTLENLETLSLYDTHVTAEDLAPLAGLKKLHDLDLGYAAVGTDGLEYLRQMKQLKSLRISGVWRNEEESFQAELPNCEVIFH